MNCFTVKWRTSSFLFFFFRLFRSCYCVQIIVCCCLLSAANLSHARVTAGGVKIVLTPDHADFFYHVGEKFLCKVKITDSSDHPLLNITKVYLQAGKEKMPITISKEVLLKNGEANLDCGTLNEAGFLRCTVTAELAGKTYKVISTAAFDPYALQPTVHLPDDFELFWGNVRENSRKIPMIPSMSLRPGLSTKTVDTYEISFQNNREGSRIYGILCLPKAPGKYPALLKVPGAGVRSYKGAVGLAESGMITLEIGIHGIPVTLDDSIYKNLASGALSNYQFYNFDDKENYYYKRVIAGCLKAIDYLFTLPQFNQTDLAVLGTSQGGALAIITTALDQRVNYLASYHPALCDLTGYLHDRAGGWPHVFNKYTQANVDSNRLKTAGYYDVVNFARLLKVPGIYTWGFNDEVCPPTSMFAAYNIVKASKDYLPEPEAGHVVTDMTWKKVRGWLVDHLIHQ